jgi:alpha-tubulin suppressor-like RCC1 family protein
VYAFGDSTDGKLGLGDVTALKLENVIYKPTLVSALRGEKIIKVPTSKERGHQGSKERARVGSSHKRFCDLRGATQVAAAGAHSAALSSRGTVFTWGTFTPTRQHAVHNTQITLVQRPGFSSNYRLGLTQNTGSVPVPAEVLCIGDASRPFIVDLWCGKNVTLLLDDQGVLYSFGVTNWYPCIYPTAERSRVVWCSPLNWSARARARAHTHTHIHTYIHSLGRSSKQDNGVESEGRPLPVVFPGGVKIKSAAMGSEHGLAITTDGTKRSLHIETSARMRVARRTHTVPPARAW